MATAYRAVPLLAHFLEPARLRLCSPRLAGRPIIPPASRPRHQGTLSAPPNTDTAPRPEPGAAVDPARQQLHLQPRPWPGQTESLDNPLPAPAPATLRYPKNVQALYLKPLRREAQYGIPSCDLQLRSFSVSNLEVFADFALRAAYYLGLPAFGPVPLPRITERWTVPKSTFIFKKAQENFERITLRRLVQIRDGNTDTVQIWLAFLQKHAYYGVGMKANVWEFSKLGVGKSMAEVNIDGSEAMARAWSHLGQHHELGSVEEIQEMLRQGRRKAIHGPG